LLAHEKPKLKGWAAVRASPVTRFGGLVALGAILIGAVVVGFIVPRLNQVGPPTITPGPSPTYTLTPTALNATGQPAVVGTPAPLSELFRAIYANASMLRCKVLHCRYLSWWRAPMQKATGTKSSVFAEVVQPR
jgi:hypothetical protein